MKYILIILLSIMCGCSATGDLPVSEDSTQTECHDSFSFENATEVEDLPISCNTRDGQECCTWVTEPGCHMEMCLDEDCLWDPKSEVCGS